jgi:hypothetical protein
MASGDVYRDLVKTNGFPNEYSYEYKVYISQTPNTSDGDVIRVRRPPLSFPAHHGVYYYIAVALVDEHDYSGPVSDTIIIGNSLASSMPSIDCLISCVFELMCESKPISHLKVR